MGHYYDLMHGVPLHLDSCYRLMPLQFVCTIPACLASNSALQHNYIAYKTLSMPIPTLRTYPLWASLVVYSI